MNESRSHQHRHEKCPFELTSFSQTNCTMGTKCCNCPILASTIYVYFFRFVLVKQATIFWFFEWLFFSPLYFERCNLFILFFLSLYLWFEYFEKQSNWIYLIFPRFKFDKKNNNNNNLKSANWRKQFKFLWNKWNCVWKILELRNVI